MLNEIDLNDILFLDIETVPLERMFSDLSERSQKLWEKKSLFFRSEEETPSDVYGRAGIYAEFGKIIINALIDGPQEGLMRTIPSGTILRALYVTQDGTAYVDISDAIKDAHPGGIKSELFTIYSIVNTIILNIPGIDAVKILIEGRESMTLAGHIDLRFPFKAVMLFIR
mgnify:CR=1 FL=1